MNDDFRFAAAVAEFGMLLRDSQYKGTSSKDSVLELLSQNDFADDEYKTEFKDLVENAIIS